jgi:DNA-binding protein H-NS
MRRMTLASVERQIQSLQAKAEKLKVRDKIPAVREIIGLMKDHGISVPELHAAVDGRAKARKASRSKLKGRKIKPMYRNPKTGETWSGRGRAARWIVALEKAGRKRAEFLIKKT